MEKLEGEHTNLWIKRLVTIQILWFNDVKIGIMKNTRGMPCGRGQTVPESSEIIPIHL